MHHPKLQEVQDKIVKALVGTVVRLNFHPNLEETYGIFECEDGQYFVREWVKVPCEPKYYYCTDMQGRLTLAPYSNFHIKPMRWYIDPDMIDYVGVCSYDKYFPAKGVIVLKTKGG